MAYTENDLRRAFEEGGWFHEWEQRNEDPELRPRDIEELIKIIKSEKMKLNLLTVTDLSLENDPTVIDLFDLEWHYHVRAKLGIEDEQIEWLTENYLLFMYDKGFLVTKRFDDIITLLNGEFSDNIKPLESDKVFLFEFETMEDVNDYLKEYYLE